MLEEQKRVLNLGCGNQMFGTHRVDMFPSAATTHVFDVERGLKFQDEFFDEIYERNLLEHLRNVGFHLDECFRVLKKGGKITLITDNAACNRYYLLGTHEGRYEEKHGNDFHFCIFTKNHLKNHFQKAGFRIEKLIYVESDTIGRIIDRITRQHPRIMVAAIK